MKKLIFSILLIPFVVFSQNKPHPAIVKSLGFFDYDKGGRDYVNPGDTVYLINLKQDKIWNGIFKGKAGTINEMYFNASDQIFQASAEAAKNAQEEKLEGWAKLVISKKIYGIAITNYKVTGEDYTAGFNIQFYNPTIKTIKYIWITTRAINPVGDLAVPSKTVQAIGPILPGDIGSYEFEDTYYSRVIDKLQVTKLKIQYMDGSIKELVAPVLSKVWTLSD